MFFFLHNLCYTTTDMKKLLKSSTMVFVFLVAVCGALFSLGGAGNVAHAESAKIVAEGNKTTFAYEDFDDKNEVISLKISDFDFEVGDKVVWYYKNTTSANFIYQSLYDYHDDHSGSHGVIITEQNISDCGQIFINLLNMEGEFFGATGLGTYVIKANIIRGSTVVTPAQVSLSVEDKITTGGGYRLTIYCQKTPDKSTEFGSYRCTATLTYNNIVMSLDGLELRWYFVNSASTKPFTNHQAFVWTPEERGSYMLQAKVLIGDNLVESKIASLDVSTDKTTEVLIVAGAVAGVMTIGVVIGVIISVKRERVW